MHGFISFQRNYGGYSVLRIGNQNKGKRKAIGKWNMKKILNPKQ